MADFIPGFAPPANRQPPAPPLGVELCSGEEIDVDDEWTEAEEPDSSLAAEKSPTDMIALAKTANGQESEPKPLRGVVVGRRRQHRLDVELVNGSIADVDARAVVLGLFQHVKPEGAAAIYDNLLDGAITEFSKRRMFSAGVGEVFMLPTGTHPVRAEFVVFSGLGSYDKFCNESQTMVATNVIRSLIHAGIDEFATVLFGGGSGADIGSTLESLISGFVSGLLEADKRHSFRRVILCARNPERYAAMRQRLYELASTSLFDEIELTIDETKPTVTTIHPVRSAAPSSAALPPIYLTVRQADVPNEPDLSEFKMAALTVGSKATVQSSTKRCNYQELTGLLSELEGVVDLDMARFGQELMDLIVDDDLHDTLRSQTFRNHPLVVVHDIRSSSIPWETIHLGGSSPAVNAGMTRQYMAENMTIAKWLERRRIGRTLDILLIANPTQDLDGAEREGTTIAAELGQLPCIRVTKVEGPEATRKRLLEEFQSGKYDVIHYAGHAEFNEIERGRSGIICAGGEVLHGEDLTALSNLPALVFFNACESGRIFGPASDLTGSAHRSVGFAEAFLRGGVANFIGTYWPVCDDAAITFAREFYPRLVDGKTLGEALLSARNAVRNLNSNDWADYMLYGSPDFSLKEID